MYRGSLELLINQMVTESNYSVNDIVLINYCSQRSYQYFHREYIFGVCGFFLRIETGSNLVTHHFRSKTVIFELDVTYFGADNFAKLYSR